METRLTERGLLRVVLIAFVLLLAYRFLAVVTATVLLLATGLLLAVALSQLLGRDTGRPDRGALRPPLPDRDARWWTGS
ncbi:MAG: hypothetical protein AB1425_13445 [Actinomycetota bacterium]